MTWPDKAEECSEETDDGVAEGRALPWSHKWGSAGFAPTGASPR
jgi:hypothetical protein